VSVRRRALVRLKPDGKELKAKITKRQECSGCLRLQSAACHWRSDLISKSATNSLRSGCARAASICSALSRVARPY
jgi:hypothetical protein